MPCGPFGRTSCPRHFCTQLCIGGRQSSHTSSAMLRTDETFRSAVVKSLPSKQSHPFNRNFHFQLAATPGDLQRENSSPVLNTRRCPRRPERQAWDTARRFLARDRDSSSGTEFKKRVDAMGITEVLTAPRSPWQNPYVERVIVSMANCWFCWKISNSRHTGS